MASVRTFADADRNVAARVQDEVKADYTKNFARGGTVFFQRFPAFTLCFPSINAQQYPPGFLEHVTKGLTDKHAKDTLERDFKCLNWQSECTYLIPLYTTGDGNCLLHASSLAMWGIEDKQFILRNALYDSLITALPDSNTLQDRCRQAVGELLRGVNVNLSDHDWDGEWRMIVHQATPNKSGFQQSLEESHIFVLSNILRRPIIVYGVPKVRSFNTGGTMQNINFHGIYLPLLWGSQLCHKAPLCLGYSMGHFTALVPVSTPHKQATVPIVDNTGRDLPIRFLLQAEQQNTFYLLQQYLDITQQYSSTLRKQVSVATLVIREATHVPQLVNSYINAAFTEFTKQNQPYYAQNQPAAAPPQNEDVQRQPCIGCDSGVYASAETNFLCSVCYRKHRSAAANYSGGIKCRSSGCQEQGLTSKDGYCNNCYTRNPQGGNDQFYSNNFDQVGRNNIQNPLTTGGSETSERPKCRQCKEFFANEELNGLCSSCFKKLSIKESSEKPPVQKQQFAPPATPIQSANNTEPAAVKCYKCRQYHGDQQWGGLCSMCFKEKSKQEANAKQPGQMRNDFQQPTPPNQQPWGNQQPPPQQPAYGQGTFNSQPPNPQQMSSPFGEPCMTQSCARFADDDCQGYCTQCFVSRVERVQQQQQQLQQQQQRRQQEEQERRRQLELEQTRRREEEERRLANAKQEEQWRRQQEQQANQQRHIQTANLGSTIEHQNQHQPSPREYNSSHTAPVVGLCRNQMCSQLASPNCEGYCSGCFAGQNQAPVPSNANPTQGEKAPTPSNISPTQRQKAPPPSDTNPAMQRPTIKPRSKTGLKPLVREEPASEVSQTKEASATSAQHCFMCTGRKPTTADLMYSLCQKHAQLVLSSLGPEIKSPPEPSMQQQQQPVTQSGTQEPYNMLPETNREQQWQRRGSAFDDQSSGYSSEQKVTHNSGEQYAMRTPMTRHSGEQPNRSPNFPGTSQNINQPMGAPNNFSGGGQCNDNQGSQFHGQMGPPMNSSAPYSSSTQGGNQFSSQSGGQPSHQSYNNGGQFNGQRPMQNEAPYQGSGDQLFSGISQAHPQSKIPPQQMQQNNNWGSGSSGVARNPNDIRYPPGDFSSPAGDLRDQRQYNSQHVPAPSNQYNGQPHHNQHGSNNPQYPYQQQSQFQNQGQYQDHQQQSTYYQNQPNQGGGAGGKMSRDDGGYYPSQAGGHREGPGPGPGRQQFPTTKPNIDTRAALDREVAHQEMPNAKVLCKYPGCSFYAISELDNYCQDCFDKSGLKNYQRCQNPQCDNKVPGHVAKYCDSCVTRRH